MKLRHAYVLVLLGCHVLFAVRVKTRRLVSLATSNSQWRRGAPRRSNPREQRSVGSMVT